MTLATVHKGDFHGEPAYWLKAADYEAAVLPAMGANLIAFRDTKKQYRFLHEPAASEMEHFRANPGIYGIPVLFPPNRYEDGKFRWNGKVYQLPVNEPERGNHLHGFVHTIPWTVTQAGTDEEAAWITLELKVAAGHEVYTYLPHEFTIRLRYTLDAWGLHQQVTVKNDGQDLMPCLLAFHTAVNAPFAAGSKPEDYSYTLTVGSRWAMNERMLPTGELLPLEAEESKMREQGLNPYWEAMDNHYTAVPRNGRNRMELTDRRENVTLVYDVGAGYKQWMIWNNEACGQFFCPEPQVNLVNAPNVDLPAEEIGLLSLAPGEMWEETSRLYMKPGVQA